MFICLKKLENQWKMLIKMAKIINTVKANALPDEIDFVW